MISRICKINLENCAFHWFVFYDCTMAVNIISTLSINLPQKGKMCGSSPDEQGDPLFCHHKHCKQRNELNTIPL